MRTASVVLGFVSIGMSLFGLARLMRRDAPPTTADLTALVVNSFALAVGTAAILVTVAAS